MRYCLITLLLAAFLPALAQERNLEELYRQIDEAIDHSPEYVAAYETRINEVKESYAREWSNEEKLKRLLQIYDLYKAYNNDSALYYVQQYIDLAEEMGLGDAACSGKVKMAYQCSTVGLYTEALGILRSLDRSKMDKATLTNYYVTCMHVYGELGYYTRMPSMGEEYQKLNNVYRDSVFATANPKSEDYLLRYETKLFNEQKYEEALKVNDQRMRLVKENTREYAIVAYYRHLIYRNKGNLEEAKYWLGQSGLCDVKQAVMDQASLLSLAEMLNNEGDFSRSYKYIRFTWDCNNRFNTRMRSWQISPILTVIENNYQNEMDRNAKVLTGSIIVVSILALLLVGALLFLRRRNSQLATARNALHDTNTRLATLNDELQQANDQLSAANGQFVTLNSRLKDANAVKEEYIGRFLSLCAQYVDKLDNYRKMVNKKMKNKELDELYRITKSTELKEQEIEELNQNFDSVFLHLFPNFIDDFNALLEPELQIHPREANHLTTDLRIFALIRLGIDDSSKIAEFLHYSVNTIYNYRARIKNGAVVDREDFERMVKELGMPR